MTRLKPLAFLPDESWMDLVALLALEAETAGKKPLRDLSLFPEHRLVADLPSRADLYEEIFSREDPGPRP